VEHGSAQSEDRAPPAQPALPAEPGHRSAGRHRAGPVDLPAREVAGIVERARIAEVARLAQPCLDLHHLAVAELRRRIAVARIKRDARVGIGAELQDELLAAWRPFRRLDDTAS